MENFTMSSVINFTISTCKMQFLRIYIYVFHLSLMTYYTHINKYCIDALIEVIHFGLLHLFLPLGIYINDLD